MTAYLELTSESSIIDVIEYHNAHSPYVVIDLETTGLNYFTDKILDIVISGSNLDSAVTFSGEFLTLLKRCKKPLVGHNLKFDMHMAYRAGVDLRQSGIQGDTMLLDHLLDENNDHDLDSIIKRYFNDDYKEKFWAEFKEYTDAPRERQIEYACQDAIYTGKAYRTLRDLLSRTGIPDSLIEHAHSLALSLYQTELDGVKLDLDYLSQVGQELTQKIGSNRVKMRELVQVECETLELDQYLVELDKRKTDKGKANVKRPVFNFDSVAQLGKLLYDELSLPEQLNKKRSRTVDDAALEKLETLHPIIPLIRDYRGHQKVYTAFIEGSLAKMHEGRIHPSFNVNGTVTGRISSSGPNLQQLPKEGGIRGIYVPDPGQVLISCDYAQLEVTLAAHFSKDANLLRIVNEGASQHDITAQGLGIPRALAKTINFAMQYGAGVQKVQKVLGCSEADAQLALDKYWETYSGLRDLIKRCHKLIEEGRPIVNPFGRQRRFPTYEQVKEQYGKEGFYSKREDKYIYKRDLVWAGFQRQAPNSLVQGTGADITNRAFYLVNQELMRLGIGKALFPIHDEVLITVKADKSDIAREVLSRIMVDVGKEINLSVSLGVDCSKPMTRWEKG